MSKQSLVKLIIFICLASLPACAQEEPLDKGPWSENRPEKIAFTTDPQGTSMRRLTYSADGFTKKQEQITYNNGTTAVVDYSKTGVIAKMVEHFPRADKNSPAKLKRTTVFDEFGQPVLDQILRPDGTMKAVSTSIIEAKTKEYRTIIFYPDGKNHREQSALDWQKTGWSLVTLTTLRIDGSIESETVRQKNGSYIRTVYTNEKLTLKIETWSADRTMVRSIFYAPDGKRVVRQTDENPNEMTVTTFNQNEKVDHIHYWTPSLEVVTAYSSEGIALVRKLWSVPFGEPEPVKRKISRIEEIQGNNGITRSYSFFLDGKTVQFYIEKKRAPTGKSITTTYLFDENGLLKHVESQDDKGMTLSQKNYKKGIKKEIPLDPDYLIYKPYKKPPSTLKSKPIPSKPHDAV